MIINMSDMIINMLLICQILLISGKNLLLIMLTAFSVSKLSQMCNRKECFSQLAR